MSRMRKQKFFVFVNTLVWCLIGLFAWLLIGDRFIDNSLYAVCFVGYPGFFLGLVGGIFYPYIRQHTSANH